MENDSEARFYQTNPSETKNQCPDCTHMGSRCALVPQEQKEELAKVQSENPHPAQAGNDSVVTNCEIGHLCCSPPQDQ